MADITTYPLKSVRNEVITVYAAATIGASGAPTLVAADSYGVTSISRTGAGLYTITLRDAYNAIQFADGKLFADNPAEDIRVNFDLNGSSAVTKAILLATLTGATATDPSSGSKLYVKIELRNSNAF